MKKITAKFNSRCLDCGVKIEAGDECWWTVGEGVRCEPCHQDMLDTINNKANSPIQPVQKGVTVRYNGPLDKQYRRGPHP